MTENSPLNNVTPDDRRRLVAIVGNRNAPQKHILGCQNPRCHRRRLRQGRDLAAMRSRVGSKDLRGVDEFRGDLPGVQRASANGRSSSRPERAIRHELEFEGNQRQIKRLGRKPSFLEGDKLESESRTRAPGARSTRAYARYRRWKCSMLFSGRLKGVATVVTPLLNRRCNCRNGVTLGRSRRRARS